MKIKDRSLYLVISEECGRGRSAVEIAESAIVGGIDLIQMREKNKTKNELIALGRKLSAMCRENGVKFIVNDDPFVAIESGADGVHLGQDDTKRFSINETRKIVGKNRIIGLSTHSLEQLERANECDVDYISYGPIFPTKTKDYFLGTKDIERVLEMTHRPVFFIGGINLSNIEELLTMGAKNIAMIRAITEAEDIAGRAQSFKEKMKRQKENESGRSIAHRR